MKKELRVLMLEDLEEDAGLIERALIKEDFQMKYLRVDEREEFIASLDTFKPDIILSDHSLPQFNSIEALKICQEKQYRGPFILVTGTVSDEFAVTCIKQGADDYVLKSNLTRLPLAIKSAIAHREHESLKLQQQEALQKQNIELIKINNELDSFVYSASHNLRAPLSSIIGLVRLAKLENDIEPSLLSKYFTMIEQSVLKLDDTIKEIIDYSKNSRSEIIITKINFEELINSVFNELIFLSGYNEIKQSVSVEKETELYTDEYRLKVIMSNLIMNAIKYRDRLKPTQQVKIKAKFTQEMAIIELIDNGIGIESDLLPHVLDMFFRATNQEEGAGLGLYIVKEMLNKLKGTININSKLGEGTSLTIRIPNNS